MPRRSIIAEDEETEINLSPMIDCIFILLIFFIVTTVFVEEKGVQVSKPDASASASLEEKENVTLEITAEDKILFGGKEIALAEVTGREVVYFDERFTSAEAEQSLLGADMTSKRRARRLDMVAAQIMLSAFLESGGQGQDHPDALDG